MNILNTIWDWIYAFFIRYVVKPIMVMDVRDIVDVLLLAVILFEVYRFARTRRAGRVLVGLLIVVFCSALMVSFQLPSLAYIVRLLAAAAFFCIIVIFQPEIRDMLEHFKNLLSEKGKIEFKTDNRDLFDFSLIEFEESGYVLENVTFDLHASEWAKDNIVTEYEANFSAKGFKINRLEAYLPDKS